MSPQKGQIEHFSRIPDSVLLSRHLSVHARLVYALLAGRSRKYGAVVCGMRMIADKLGISKNTATSAIAELVKQGHVTSLGIGKQRGSYMLASPIFRPKTWTAEVAGEVITYTDHGPVVHKQITQSRQPVSHPRSARKSA